MKKLLVFYFTLGACAICFPQKFTKNDTLRGSITPERAWWDVLHYDLKVTVNPKEKTISGSNTISYRVLEAHDKMQIDLQPPMVLNNAVQNNQSLTLTRKGNVYYIDLLDTQPKDSVLKITLLFAGQPVEALNPPWDGGYTWSRDSNGKDFIATSNQGIGASVWWPNKDHPYDEPDQGVTLAITTPKDLVGVGNGRLINTQENEENTTWTWQVTQPINNYGVNVNVGDYVTFSETYKGEKGPLDISYWVLRENKSKAKKQFTQVPKMLEAFEYWFGPYPFYEDSFKLVEVPYLGMEHQSSVTYGNKYKNGYLGRDLSGSGWGLKFDFIIIHEAGHEWFANSITNSDVAYMWLHEGFTAYSENLYLDYHFGTEAANAYVVGTKKLIQNDRPIMGIPNVNHEGSSDMYYKGANILHTLRQLLENDEKWRQILRGLNKEFYHQNVTTTQIENYLSTHTGIDLTAFFNQYVRTNKIPLLEYSINNNTLSYRYTDVVEDFDMPVQIMINKNVQWLFPTKEWKTLTTQTPISQVELDSNFLVDIQHAND